MRIVYSAWVLDFCLSTNYTDAYLHMIVCVCTFVFMYPAHPSQIFAPTQIQSAHCWDPI